MDRCLKKTLKATDIVLATDIKEEGFFLLDQSFDKGAKIGDGDLETKVLTEPEKAMNLWKLTLPETVKMENKVWLIVRHTLS